MENEDFNPDLQETGDYEEEVDNEIKAQEDESAKQRLQRIEEALGKDSVDELVWEADHPDEPFPDPQQKPLFALNESEIDALDPDELAGYAKPVMKETARQMRDDNSQLNKDFKIAKRIIENEFPELGSNEINGGKFPYIYSHLKRVNIEMPTVPFEEKVRIASERTVDYLGLRETVNHRRTSSYVKMQQQAQNRVKQTFNAEQRYNDLHGKEK